MTVLTIPLPWPKPPLSQNDRNDRRTGGARKIAEAKRQAAAAIAAASPRPVAGANVDIHWAIPTRHRRDGDNLGPTLKVCLDALVAEGVLPDDSWAHVPRSGHVIHPPQPDQPAAMWLELLVLTEPDKDAP